MKKVEFFHLEFCPYCIAAQNHLDVLLTDEKYRDIAIVKVNEVEEKQYADSKDYYYVPTFYYGDDKLFEGIMTKEDVQEMLDKVLAYAR